MSMDEESTIKATCRYNAPVECWGCTDSPRYHADKFHIYRNCPNKRDPYVAKWEKESVQVC